MKPNVQLILEELSQVFSSGPPEAEELLVAELVGAERIVCVGAGRVGLAMAGFAKRMRHLDKSAFWIDDKTLPRMGKGDLMVVGSGSGETETTLTLARLGKREGLRVALITATKSSRLKEIADVTVTLNCSDQAMRQVGGSSRQPMTSLFEQSCQLYLDGIVLTLMDRLNISGQEMKELHNGIE